MKRFIQGILFISVIIPIIDNLLSVISQLTKHLCTMIAVKTYELEKTVEEEPEYCTNAIGFQVDTSTDECYDEEGRKRK